MKEMCPHILIKDISFPLQTSVITTASIPRLAHCPVPDTLSACARLAMKASSVMSTSACGATEHHVSLMEIQEMWLAS